MWDEDIGEHSRFARFSREDNSTKGVMVLVHAAFSTRQEMTKGRPYFVKVFIKLEMMK